MLCLYWRANNTLLLHTYPRYWSICWRNESSCYEILYHPSHFHNLHLQKQQVCCYIHRNNKAYNALYFSNASRFYKQHYNEHVWAIYENLIATPIAKERYECVPTLQTWSCPLSPNKENYAFHYHIDMQVGIEHSNSLVWPQHVPR